MIKKETKIFSLLKLPEIKINFSSRFLLACTSLDAQKLIAVPNTNKFINGYDVLKYFGFINLYMWDENKETNKNSLLLLFNPNITKLHQWYMFKDVYLQFFNYIGEYYIERGLIILEFKISDKDLYSFKDYLLKGEYSKMNIKNYVNNFKKVEKNKAVLSKEGSIILKSTEYKKMLENELGIILPENAELGSIPDVSQEHLQLNYINLWK